jgi:hypothetical protein
MTRRGDQWQKDLNRNRGLRAVQADRQDLAALNGRNAPIPPRQSASFDRLAETGYSESAARQKTGREQLARFERQPDGTYLREVSSQVLETRTFQHELWKLFTEAGLELKDIKCDPPPTYRKCTTLQALKDTVVTARKPNNRKEEMLIVRLSEPQFKALAEHYSERGGPGAGR